MTQQPCIEFGRELILSNDLDPVYTILWNANFDRMKMQKWLLAYWSFYHMGTASWISEGQLLVRGGYWERFMKAAKSKEYPRCPERRHFRGQNAINSVTYLQAQGIAALFKPLLLPRKQTAAEVMSKVQEWVGFGPWIAFKVSDMIERLGLATVEFDTKTVFLFDSPKEGAQRLWESLGKPQTVATRIESWAVETITSELDDLKAPPRFERPINAQEAETILCKWKSYQNGKYHIGEDIKSCRKSLLTFARCNTSQALIQAGTRGGLW